MSFRYPSLPFTSNLSASKQMQGTTGHLQGKSCSFDRLSAFRHRGTHQEHCGNHPHHRREGRHSLPFTRLAKVKDCKYLGYENDRKWPTHLPLGYLNHSIWTSDVWSLTLFFPFLSLFPALQKPGARVLKPTPRKIGAKTTWKVETTMPPASTGTTAPKTTLQINGVMKMQPRVVEVVINTCAGRNGAKWLDGVETSFNPTPDLIQQCQSSSQRVKLFYDKKSLTEILNSHRMIETFNILNPQATCENLTFKPPKSH